MRRTSPAARIAWLVYRGLGTLCLIGLFGYYVWLEPPYLTYVGTPFRVDVTAPLHPGDVVPLEVSRCNADRTTHTYTMSRTLRRLDAEQPDILLPAATFSIPPGCTKSVSRAHSLPEKIDDRTPLPPGSYKLLGVSNIDATIRNIEVTWSSQGFEVTPR